MAEFKARWHKELPEAADVPERGFVSLAAVVSLIGSTTSGGPSWQAESRTTRSGHRAVVRALGVRGGNGVPFALTGASYAHLLGFQEVTAARLLDARDLAPVRRFALLVRGALSSVAVAVAFTPFGVHAFAGVGGVHDAILDEAIEAMAFLWPVPILTGVRRAPSGAPRRRSSPGQ